jgi:hypothetical protein
MQQYSFCIMSLFAKISEITFGFHVRYILQWANTDQNLICQINFSIGSPYQISSKLIHWFQK